MRQTFTKESLIMLDGMVAAVIGNGSAFVHTANGDQIYVPSRQISMMNVDAGDTVRCWCFFNDPEHAHTAKYRSVRSMALQRLTDAAQPSAMAEALGRSQEAMSGDGDTLVAEPSTASPAPSLPRKVEPLEGEELYLTLDAIMDRSQILTAKDIHAIVCDDRPEHWGDPKLLLRLTSALNTMNAKGEVAVIRVFRDTEQTNASAVLYSRSTELALRIMRRTV